MPNPEIKKIMCKARNRIQKTSTMCKTVIKSVFDHDKKGLLQMYSIILL